MVLQTVVGLKDTQALFSIHTFSKRQREGPSFLNFCQN